VNQIRTAEVENAVWTGSWNMLSTTTAQIAITAAARQEMRKVRMPISLARQFAANMTPFR
jgi:hypothetical protein